jgi:hypothetical protein
MRNLVFCFIVILVSQTAYSQRIEERSLFTIGAQYTQEFILDGYVRVREWELEGDRMPLKKLGMSSYPAIQLNVTRHLEKGRSFSLVYDHYFMNGKSTFDRNVVYNGTIINGRNGIDVSPTRYFRISAIYAAPLISRPNFDLKYTAALVLDHITFYLQGEVDPSSKKDEVLEGFGRQAFPYPVLGLNATVALDATQAIHWETSGTYIPEFKSFYTEGGNVHLQYSNYQLAINYSKIICDFEVSLGTKLRYMHLFQESMEDTNVITTLTMGPFIGVTYHL